VIINMANLTGQRIGDVLKIKQSDISPDGITIIQEKTGKKTLGVCAALEENIRAARLASRPDYTDLPARTNKR